MLIKNKNVKVTNICKLIFVTFGTIDTTSYVGMTYIPSTYMHIWQSYAERMKVGADIGGQDDGQV
jgi:hypothetical protein